MDSLKVPEKDLNPLKILKKVAWPMGVWPLSDDLFSIFRTFLFVVIQISLVTCVTIEITLGCTDSDEMVDYIELQKFGTIAALKVILLRIYRKHLGQIISSINEDWSCVANPKFFKIMKAYASVGNFVFYALLISNSTMLILQIISSFPFFSSHAQNNTENNNSDDIFVERELPLRTKCLFMDVSTTSYVLVYILQSVQLFCTASGNIGIDIFFFSLAMHVCGQMEILYEEMIHFEITDNMNGTKFRIVTLIKRHQHLRGEAQTLEKTFSLTILVQLVINITGICSYGIQGIISMQTYGAFAGIKSLFGIEILLVQLFLYCYAGEKLSSRAMKLSLAIYQSCWYDLPKSLTQDVYFIIMIASLPYTLTAGKLLTMNMITFTSIVKATVSYFSVLRLMLNT